MSHAKIISEDDFLAAFDTHADALFRHAYLRTGDREMAKDLVSDSFKNLWAFIAKGNYVDCMKLYLYRDINRGIEALTAIVEVQVQHEELPADLRLWSLEQRAVFILHHVDRFSFADICAVFGGSADGHSRTIHAMRSLLPLTANA